MAATLPPPRLLPSGDSAITVEFSRTIDDAANQRVLALDKALAARADRRRHRDRADLSLAAGALRSRQDRLRRARRKAARARQPAAAADDQGAALAHSRRLWRRARHRPRGCRQGAEHHARRHRGAACRRRLPRRHDRLHAGLVLSQRPRQIPAHVAAAEPAAADARRHDLDRRHPGRRPVPGRPERLAPARPHAGAEPISCTAIRPS